ncbi:MAG: SRPBCC domain-containing protein [Hyphomicrobiaceae bacterium]
MKSFAVQVEIAASPDTIWELLTDAPHYPRWNSTVERVEGEIASGGKLKVFTKAAPDRGFPLTVTAFERPGRMVWSGGMPLGLFKGERTYEITARAGGRTAFVMREVFSGLLAPLITRSIPDLQPAFDAFAADLKRAAEARS